jgi:glycosyltransferase involved in cell wall biosynthesis
VPTPEPASRPESSAVLSLSIVVPAYQEADTIEPALVRLQDELQQIGQSFEVLLVCDGCTDGTGDAARGASFPELRVVEYSPNQGKGYALRTGFAESRGETVVFIDADLDIHPSGIATLLELMRSSSADAVVASKVHPDSRVHYPYFRRVQSRVFRWLVKRSFSLEVTDSQTGLKVFRRPVLSRCLPLVKTTGFAFDLELLVLANDAGFRVIEGPVQLDYQFSTTTGVTAVLSTLREFGTIAMRRRHERHAGRWITPTPR